MPAEPKNYRYDEDLGKYRESTKMKPRTPPRTEGERSMGIIRGTEPAYGKGGAYAAGGYPAIGKDGMPAYGGAPPGFAGSLAAAGGAVGESPYQKMYGDIYGQLGAMAQTPARGGGGGGRRPVIGTPEYGEGYKGFREKTAGYIGGLMDKNPYGQAAINVRENIMRGTSQYTDETIDRQAQQGGYFGTERHRMEKEKARHGLEQNVEMTRQQMMEAGAQYGLNVGQVATKFAADYRDAELGMAELRQRADFKRADIQVQYRQMAISASRARTNDVFKALSMQLGVIGAMRGESMDMIGNYWTATKFQFDIEGRDIATQESAKNRQLHKDLAKMEAKGKKKGGIFGVLGTIGGAIVGGPMGAKIGGAIGGLFDKKRSYTGMTGESGVDYG